jgi:CheY-like chemotaxis protein
MSTPARRPSRLPVLLIEDEPAVMSYVRAVLERSGYSVLCCDSGAEGLRRLESGEFQGVVSDMRTPGGVNGADVYDWIVSNRPAASTLERTGVPCVEKPFRVQQFISVVEETMGKPI